MTLPCPLAVIAAPMAGGPSTPELVAAVSEAGGFGFLGGGYLTAQSLEHMIAATRARTSRPFGVNLFVPAADTADPVAIAAYATTLSAQAQRLGVDLGTASWDDDHYAAKLDALMRTDVHLVSFTFGAPSCDVVESLHRCGTRVAVTVTSAQEAREAAGSGADLLVVQGVEAGGHQGTFVADRISETPLLTLLVELREITDLPLVAAGGIGTRDQAQTAMAAGAVAVQLGTALLCSDEAGTSPVHRAALLERRFTDTELTRAFSGRWARALTNRFVREHRDAPAGYPQLNQLTRPVRSAAAAAGDADVPSLWAGTSWPETLAGPAAEIVRAIAP